MVGASQVLQGEREEWKRARSVGDLVAAAQKVVLPTLLGIGVGVGVGLELGLGLGLGLGIDRVAAAQTVVLPTLIGLG